MSLDPKLPLDTLRAWLLLFVNVLETKRDIAGVQDTLIGGCEPLYSGTPARLSPAINMLVARVNAGDDARFDVNPLNLLRAIVGVAIIHSGLDWKQQARTIVDLLLGGAQIATRRT